ncbi:MAG: hypothetical protein GWN00_12195 [Aliifodinibius sp.]|nr:hypothetical protein [Fodinibius sp.]NIV11895.1 hypothetical protein [Fodinibius sp.]NIY25541.1 hypothetical protein [Fodinibius sp.]
MSRDFFHTAQVLKRFENVIKWYWDEDSDQVDDFDFKIKDLIRDLPMVLGIDWGKQMKLMILDEYKDFQ